MEQDKAFVSHGGTEVTERKKNFWLSGATTKKVSAPAGQENCHSAVAGNVHKATDTSHTFLMELNQLSSQIIKAAIAVHKELGPGLLESVY